MAATAWTIFNKAKEYMMDGTFDMDDAGADIFKCALFDVNYTPALTDTTYTLISGDEIANGNGYTTAGVSLTGVTWVESSGTVTWDCNDIYWDASGAGLSGIRHAVIYHVATDYLICYSTLDSADISVSASNRLTIQVNTSGIFTLA